MRHRAGLGVVLGAALAHAPIGLHYLARGHLAELLGGYVGSAWGLAYIEHNAGTPLVRAAWEGLAATLHFLALPLAVLSVLAVRHARGDRPLPVVAVVLTLAVLLVPGTVYRADQLHAAVTLGRQPFLLTTGERDALRWMEHSGQPGGVLTPVYSGLLVPAYTGRESYIGAGSWTPDFATRQQQTEDLLAGRLSPAASQALVRATGPAFVYADCHDRADITRQLGDVVTGPPLRFGCARVWRVRPQYVRDLG